jgi:hypothetical protein
LSNIVSASRRFGVAVAAYQAGDNDRGPFYGVLECTVDDQPDADPIAMFAAVNVGDTLKDANGALDFDKLGSDPVAKKQFFGGLVMVEKLILLSNVEMSEIEDASDADDMLANFVGQRFVAIVGSGTDQYGLKNNTLNGSSKASTMTNAQSYAALADELVDMGYDRHPSPERRQGTSLHRVGGGQRHPRHVQTARQMDLARSIRWGRHGVRRSGVWPRSRSNERDRRHRCPRIGG